MGSTWEPLLGKFQLKLVPRKDFAFESIPGEGFTIETIQESFISEIIPREGFTFKIMTRYILLMKLFPGRVLHLKPITGGFNLLKSSSWVV